LKWSMEEGIGEGKNNVGILFLARIKQNHFASH
jgi:hypothetical protein